MKTKTKTWLELASNDLIFSDKAYTPAYGVKTLSQTKELFKWIEQRLK